MPLDNDVAIALTATLLNFVLALVVPMLLKDNTNTILSNIRQHYEVNRRTIILSSLIVFVFVLVSLKITPMVNDNVYSRLASLNPNK